MCNFKGNFSATAIGSLPHTDTEAACNLVLSSLQEIPCWPQLPKHDIREDMCIQYTEGLPCSSLNGHNKTVLIDDTQDTSEELENFYRMYLNNNPEAFSISQEYSSGFYAMIERLNKKRPEHIRALKGQIVGPITQAGSVKLSSGITALYSEVFFDVIIKLLSMKAAWQLAHLSRYGVPVIIFADEPYLSSFGSAYMNITRERVISTLNEVYESIQMHGGLAGTHCCGNTDWSMLMESRVNIVSFDAYEFMDKYLMYWREIKDFVTRGGYLAWGIIPTSSKITSISADDLVKKLEEGVQFLIRKGLSKEFIREKSLITPSCGAGTLTITEAEKVMTLSHEVSSIMQNR